MKTNFTKNLGAHGKHLEQFIEPQLWGTFKKTYVGTDYGDMSEALGAMFEIFNFLALEISQNFKFEYDISQYQKVLGFIQSKIKSK